MTESERVGAGSVAAVPPLTVPRRIDDALVDAVLAALGAAGGPLSVAEAPLTALLELEGVRAAAVLVRHVGEAVVVASNGYRCGVMAPGAVLPIDAGLPVTEALRRRALVVQGAGPSWVALPFEPAGALLLSLDSAPPDDPAELWRLRRVARSLGEALVRSADSEPAAADPQPVEIPAQVEVAVRCLPYDGDTGGDIALALPDGRGGHWLVVADVCGYGAAAAAVASAVSATFVALAPLMDGPAALLTGCDRVTRALVGSDRFVTAAALHVRHRRLTAASAGHPPPLLLTSAGARALEPEPSPPLGLDVGPAPVPVELVEELPDDAVLLLHTDGLVDRRGSDRPVPVDVRDLVRGMHLTDLEGLADDVLRAAGAAGAASDDVTLLLARPRG